MRYLALTDLAGASPRSSAARRLRQQIPSGPRVRGLLSGQRPDGGFGAHPYKKWNGAHWRLVSLVELALPAGDPRALAAAEQVLRWLLGETHRSRVARVRGRVRRCTSQEGNALAACMRLGMAADPRVRHLADSLVEWQWPDGGWNCHKDPAARHSSFYESLAPVWGVVEFGRETGEDRHRVAARSAAEFFLRHRLFRSERRGEVIDPQWLQRHYPL